MAHGGRKFRNGGLQDNQNYTLRWVDQASRNKIPLQREGPLVNHIMVPRDQRVMSHHRIKASSLKSCLRGANQPKSSDKDSNQVAGTSTT